MRYEYCPVCDSGEIETTEYEHDENMLYIEMTCEDCNAVWYEVYKFVANENELGDILP